MIYYLTRSDITESELKELEAVLASQDPNADQSALLKPLQFLRQFKFAHGLNASGGFLLSVSRCVL